MRSVAVSAISPVAVPVRSPVAAMVPITLAVAESVSVPAMTEASRVPGVSVPAWSTSIHTTFAGVVTVHKLSALLVPVGVVPAASLCLNVVRGAHQDQKSQASNQEQVSKSYELH